MNRKQRSLLLFRLLPVAALALMSAPAWAHGGHDDLSRFMDAAVHPWTGIDHVLAALAAGMVGAHVGGRRGAAVLLAYLTGILAGAVTFGTAPPWLEVALGVSIAALGFLLRRPPLAGASLAIFSTALFGALHGSAHFFESGRIGSDVVAMAIGFELSTAVMLLSGFGLQIAISKGGIAARQSAWPLIGLGAALVLRTF